MAKVYSWEVSNSPKKYAYIVHPDDYNKAYVGTELKGTKLENVKDWAAACTDTQYEAQFNKMVALCKSKGYNVEFETAVAYMDIESTCDNLRGPAGRGIDHITLKDVDEFRNVSIYEIVYDDGETDTFEIRNGKDGQNGRDGRDGAQGDAGVSSKLIMIYTSGVDEFGNTFTPARPTGGSYNFDTYEFTRPDEGVWNLNDSDLTPPIWMSSRTFSSSPASTDKEWSLPVQLTGESGKPGVDGVSTEFIYYRDKNEPSVENLASPNEAGYVPPKETGWTASPQGVDEDNQTEWASTRKLDRTTNVWGKWSKAFRWSQYGVNGQDGDGVQYIYLKNSGQIVENPTPANYKTNETYQNRDNEWIPAAGVTYTNINWVQVKYSALEERTDDLPPAGVWTDNPSDLTANFHSQWVCSRKYRKGSDGKMAWDKFSDPALWARYGQDGKNATSIRKLYALSSDTKTYPPIPEDTTATSEWGSGFPKDYEVGVNVVWAIEAEIWAHNFEFVKTYKLASGVDEDGNVVPPADATTSNTIDVQSIPNEEVKGYAYICLNGGDYYAWSGGWSAPYIVTGVKGENGEPINYTTYVYAFGYTNYPPEAPTGTSPKYPGESTDGLGSRILWYDFPNSNVGMDGYIDPSNKQEMRWYQCVGYVNGRSGEVESWSDVQPCNGHDGTVGPQGNRTEFRFGVTADSTKPILIQKVEGFNEIRREPELYDSKGNKMGWFATDEKLPEVPSGGTMWQIWALIDGETDTVIVQDGKGWHGPVRISGEKGEQGIQGPAGMRGVTGIPGAKSIQMYCLGTYGKNEKSESYWKTGGIDGGDGYFGGKNWENNVLIDDMEKDGWFIAKDMPYSNIIKVYSLEELTAAAASSSNVGRVVNHIKSEEVNVGPTGSTSTFTHTTHQYHLIGKNGTYETLTQELDPSEEFNVYVWCIQGNEIWEAGSSSKYVNITKYDGDGNVIPPEGSDETNTVVRNSIPSEKDGIYTYILCNNKYYEWKEIDGDKVTHRLVGIEWGNPFKLQGTNGLRGLSGTRGQVVYPMGVYNSEEVYITTEDKAPYVYDPNDGMYYVYNNTEHPWVGLLPGKQEELFKTILVHPADVNSNNVFTSEDNPLTSSEIVGYKYVYYKDKYYTWNGSKYVMASKYKYSIDGSGAKGTWMTDQNGDAPANNYANAINANDTPQWVRFESFKALYTSIGIIENGLVGSAVFNNEFMFSQQGIGKNGNPTNYAVVSGRDTSYGFLSGYKYDEKGKVTEKGEVLHWYYVDTGEYINEFEVNPYEKDASGNYIHTFMPNVCINFATGQMWLCTGAIQFGINGEKNVPTNDDVAEITNRLNLWANDGYLSPVERQSLINEYNSIKAEYDGIIKQAKELKLEEATEYKDYTNAYNKAEVTFEYYIDDTNVSDGSDCIEIKTSGTYDYNNIINYYPKRQALLDKINKTINEGIASLRVGLSDIEAKVGNENIENGIVINSQFAKLFSKKVIGDETGETTLEAYVETKIEDGVSKVEISADKIFVNGETYINGQFKIDTDGKLTVKDANIENCTITDATINGSLRSPFVLDDNSGTLNSVTHDNVVVHFKDGDATVLNAAIEYPYSLQWDTSQNGRKMTIANGLWSDSNGTPEESLGFVKLVAPPEKQVTTTFYSPWNTLSTNNITKVPEGVNVNKCSAYSIYRYPDLDNPLDKPLDTWATQEAYIKVPKGVKTYTFYARRLFSTTADDLTNPDLGGDINPGGSTRPPIFDKEEILQPEVMPGHDVDTMVVTGPFGTKPVYEGEHWTKISVEVPDISEDWTITVSHQRSAQTTYNTSNAQILLPPLITTGAFFEDGIARDHILLSRELVELTGYGDENTFYGWVVTKRTDLNPASKYGRLAKSILSGSMHYVLESGSNYRPSPILNGPYLRYEQKSNGTYVCKGASIIPYAEGKYIILLNDNGKDNKIDWNEILSSRYTVIMATGYGTIMTYNSKTGYYSLSSNQNPCKACVMAKRTKLVPDSNAPGGYVYIKDDKNATLNYNGFEIWISDDTTTNYGGFNFSIFNMFDSVTGNIFLPNNII